MTETAALTVDLELFGQTPAYRSATGRSGRQTTPDTAREEAGVDGVRFLLDAFDGADATSTFFAVSSLADSHGDLLRAVADAGHEVGSHTRTHRRLPELSPAEQRAELRDSRTELAAAVDGDVTGFRAPVFELADDHFGALAEAGYRYDSSVLPSRAIPGWYDGEYDTMCPCPASEIDPAAPPGIDELPVGVMPGLGLPLTGTWVRFFGRRYTLLGMRLLARRGIAPVLYIHPWELVDLPDVDGVPARVYWRTGAWMRRTVETILETGFEFVTARRLLESDG
jgi:peptidoglycan/xylan/chitin deacetylase (PgdA/CDA1 family)